MKLNKKQTIVGVSLAILLAGGVTAGVVHNNNVQAEKVAQQAKDEHDKLIQSVKEKIAQAETYKSESDMKTAQYAIKQLDDKEKSDYTSRIEIVQKNWKLVKEADKNVSNAEKIQNDNNVKKAQTAINNLKDEKIKSKKTALQKRLDKVKVSIKNTKKQKQMTSQKGLNKEKEVANPENSSQTAESNNLETDQPKADSQTEVDSAPVENGGALDNSDVNAYQAVPQAPQTPQAPSGGGNSGSGNTSNPNPPSTGGGNTVTPPTGGGNSGGNGNTGGNNGGGTVTPPPAETFTGWVRRNGVIVWSQGGFSSLAEAGRAAAAWANAHMDFDGDWSSGAY